MSAPTVQNSGIPQAPVQRTLAPPLPPAYPPKQATKPYPVVHRTAAAPPPQPVETFDVNSILSNPGNLPPTEKEASYRNRRHQEQERRAALMMDLQAILLDRQEWAEKERLFGDMCKQETNDNVEWERLLSTLSHMEAAKTRLLKLQQLVSEALDKQLKQQQDQEQVLNTLRQQIAEKETMLVEIQQSADHRITDTTAELQRVITRGSDLQPRHTRLREELFNKQAFERHLKAQLEAARNEIARLKTRVPDVYLRPGAIDEARSISPPVTISQPILHPAPSPSPPPPLPPTATAAPAWTPVFQVVPPTPEPSMTRSEETFSPTPSLSDPLSSSDKRPVMGIEARQVQGPNGDALKVIALAPSGPAEDAGIQIGDVISSVNGITIQSKGDFAAALLSCPIGAAVPVEIYRATTTSAGRIVYNTCSLQVTMRSSRGKRNK